MWTLLDRLLREENGNDLIEYALLAGAVGIAGAAGLSLFPGVMVTVYDSWSDDRQTLWEPREPAP